MEWDPSFLSEDWLGAVGHPPTIPFGFTNNRLANNSSSPWHGG
jgi:hypothetical protein